jgi:hypothetical protein
LKHTGLAICTTKVVQQIGRFSLFRDGIHITLYCLLRPTSFDVLITLGYQLLNNVTFVTCCVVKRKPLSARMVLRCDL